MCCVVFISSSVYSIEPALVCIAGVGEHVVMPLYPLVDNPLVPEDHRAAWKC